MASFWAYSFFCTSTNAMFENLYSMLPTIANDIFVPGKEKDYNLHHQNDFLVFS